MQLYPSSGFNPSGREFRFKDPVPIFHPFAVAGVESLIPVGKETGLPEAFLDGARNQGRDGRDFGVRGCAGFHALEKTPGMRGPSGEAPWQRGKVMRFHKLS